MKFVYSLTLLLCLFVFSTYGQENVPFEKDFFKGRKKELKTALKEFKKGEHLFNHGISQYKNATKHYLKAYEINPDNALLNYRLGVCYITTIHKLESVKYFDKAYKLDPNVAPDILYELAESHHLNEDWDSAIKWYRKYEEYITENKKKFPNDFVETAYKRCEKKIYECKNGIEFSKNPVPLRLENISEINTEYNEFCPLLTADEQTMYFTSKRPGSTGITIAAEDGDHYEPEFREDIYRTEKQADGTWGKPEKLKHPLNTTGQDATVYISPDGQKMIVYNSDHGGSLYTTELDGKNWSSPKRLDSHIISEYHESSAAYSLDQKTIYFVSDRPGGTGGYDYLNADGHYTHDIYYAKYSDEKGKWGNPINIGAPINTEFNERAVFLHPDGKTLYFSSDGHNSMGGFDIFKTEFVDSAWTTPVNLGYPVNGPDHDIYFFLNASGTRGYYSSQHPDTKGEIDIYAINFLSNEEGADSTNELAVSEQKKTTILQGKITDDASDSPIKAKIEITDNDSHKVLFVSNSNSESGEFLVSLPSGGHYGIAVEADGYLFHSENFDIDDSAAYSEIEKNIALHKLDVGKKMVLKNIFFESKSTTLTKESVPELNRLAKVLTDNPEMEIEIGGHTDDTGEAKFNQNLSEKRAQAVADYLIKNGIKKDRLVVKGYGETDPKFDNKTEDGKAHNRRTEFKILKK